MNEKFFELPASRQKQIINGALKVFSASTYKQTSTIEIAREAGISKGLLFHYFRNKLELYRYLYDHSVETLMGELEKRKDLQETDFFEILMGSQRLKCQLMKEYPSMYDFLIKVYLEEDEEARQVILEASKGLVQENMEHFMERIDVSKFRDGVDIPLLFQSLKWCSDGFMREALMLGTPVDVIDARFREVLIMYKRNFYKESHHQEVFR